MRSARTVTILGLLGLLLLAALVWFVALGPRMSTADSLAQQAEETELANIQLRNRYNQALDQVREAPAAAAEAQELFASMPQAADLPTILRQISDAARDAGISPDDIQVITTTVPEPVTTAGPPVPAGVQLASLDVGITILGQRAQLLGFLDNLQELERALLVTGTQITGTGEPGSTSQETLQVNGSMFVLESTLPDLVAEVQALIDQAQATAPGEGPAATSDAS